MKGLKILGLALTGAGALITFVSSIVNDKIMTNQITEEVAKAVAKAMENK